jgi:DNA segregation ATPase FtsK/SpoIIIE-like protein
MLQVGRRNRLSKKLAEVFTDAGLKSPMGRLPGLVFDSAIDSLTRKLTLTRTNLKMDIFQSAKSALEGGLQIYIDEFRENRDRGTVDVIYSYYPMPNFVPLTDTRQSSWSFLVGKTRSKEVTINLKTVPHLMIAGQTGGGKSTFLRQVITTLYVNNKGCAFVLIDLKGGLEFQIFENLPRVEVIPNIETAIGSFRTVQQALDDRMKLLKANNCKDLDEYQKLPKEKRQAFTGMAHQINLGRQVIVIDEAAEMFLAGAHAGSKDVQMARRVLSQVARQGRSVGVHLIVATQRPDARALDPQVKANLPGILCFQMVNDASSLTVLGSGRATDLPPIPGRAIWKCGSDMVEVQTPYLGVTEAEALLEPFREKNEKPEREAKKAKLSAKDVPGYKELQNGIPT